MKQPKQASKSISSNTHALIDEILSREEKAYKFTLPRERICRLCQTALNEYRHDKKGAIWNEFLDRRHAPLDKQTFERVLRYLKNNRSALGKVYIEYLDGKGASALYLVDVLEKRMYLLQAGKVRKKQSAWTTRKPSGSSRLEQRHPVWAELSISMFNIVRRLYFLDKYADSLIAKLINGITGFDFNHRDIKSRRERKL